MKNGRILLRGTTYFLCMVSMVGLVYGQKPDKCKVKDNDNGVPKYRIGRTERTAEGPPTLLVQISVDPQHIVHGDLVALASRLKKVFCKEERVDIVIFDDYLYARNFSPVEENPYFRQGLESMRGGYYFDQTTGEEFVEFSTVPNFFKNKKDRVRIEISKISKR